MQEIVFLTSALGMNLPRKTLHHRVKSHSQRGHTVHCKVNCIMVKVIIFNMCMYWNQCYLFSYRYFKRKVFVDLQNVFCLVYCFSVYSFYIFKQFLLFKITKCFPK
jgi:hypothetical protein